MKIAKAYGCGKYQKLKNDIEIGDSIVCLKSDTVTWEAYRLYDVIRKDIDCIVLLKQQHGEFSYLWPWGRNQRIEFGTLTSQSKKKYNKALHQNCA